MDIYLIRHGEAAAGWGQAQDPELSERGARQAREAGLLLTEIIGEEAQLVASPRRRALQTAQICSEVLGRDLIVDDAFQEIPALVSLSQRRQWVIEYMAAHWREQPDPILIWRDAVIAAIKSLTRPSAIFTHALPINVVLSYIACSERTVVFYPENASIIHLRLSNGELELVALGEPMADTSQLPHVDGFSS